MAGSAEGALGSVLELRKGADLSQLRKKRLFSFSFLLWNPQLATWTGNGEAATHGSPMCVFYAAHAVYEALRSCPCDVVLQTSALPPHPWGSCHSSGKRKRWRRRGSYRLGLCCPNLFAIQYFETIQKSCCLPLASPPKSWCVLAGE